MKKSTTSLKAEAQTRLFDLTTQAIEMQKPLPDCPIYNVPRVIDEQIREILEDSADPVDQMAYAIIESTWDEWIAEIQHRVFAEMNKN